jgi:hypothetical protein
VRGLETNEGYLGWYAKPRAQSVRAETLKSDARLLTYEAPYGRASANRIYGRFPKNLKRTATISRISAVKILTANDKLSHSQQRVSEFGEMPIPDRRSPDHEALLEWAIYGIHTRVAF